MDQEANDPQPVVFKHPYQKLNYFAIIGHLLSAISMIVLLEGANSVTIPYTELYLIWMPIMKMDIVPLVADNFGAENSSGNPSSKSLDILFYLNFLYLNLSITKFKYRDEPRRL